MKCFDVKSELWSGRKSIEIDEHLASCTSCQQEMAEIGDIIGSLQTIDVPVPTRSLIPQRKIIRDTVQKNRRKPWTKLSAIAAAATIIMGVGTGIALNQMHAPKNSMESNLAGDPQQNSAGTNILIQTSEEPELMQAIKQFFERTAPAEGVSQITIQGWFKDPESTNTFATGVLTLDIKMQPGSTSTKFADGPQKQQVKLEKQGEGNWTVVSYSFQAYNVDPSRIENRIENYFQKQGTPPGVMDIKVLSFTPDQTAEEKVMTGKVLLQVTLVQKLESGQADPYHDGLNEMYVLLTKAQGVWDVEKIGLQPFQVSDAPPGVREFNQVAQIMYGTLLEVQTSTREEHGDKIHRLHTAKLKVDKNATTSNDPDKGKELSVSLEFDLPPGYMPKEGDHVVLFLAQGDPRVNMGMETWIGKRDHFFYEKDGTYYDLIGNTTDPIVAYQKLQEKR